MHEGPVFGPALVLSGLPQHPDRAETSNNVKLLGEPGVTT